jgi:hypothetical protein
VAFAWSIFIECICHCWSCNWAFWYHLLLICSAQSSKIEIDDDELELLTEGEEKCYGTTWNDV